MKPWERYTFSALSALLAVTGFAYFAMKYLMVTDDPFAVVNHPLQPLMLHLHVLGAPVFLVVFGIIWNSHIARKIGKPIPNRWSGLVSLATLIIMTVSGYLLQVVTGDTAQRVSLIAHLSSGVVFAGAYVFHLAIGLRIHVLQRRAARDTAAA